MQLPRVHLNGSGRESLKDQYREAYMKVRDAERALFEASPHGRDYYTISSDAINVAQEEHLARIKALRSVAEDLLKLYKSVDDGQ